MPGDLEEISCFRTFSGKELKVFRDRSGARGDDEDDGVVVGGGRVGSGGDDGDDDHDVKGVSNGDNHD